MSLAPSVFCRRLNIFDEVVAAQVLSVMRICALSSSGYQKWSLMVWRILLKFIRLYTMHNRLLL